MNKLLILAGPSAVGKTTVALRIMDIEPSKFELVRSATTRAPRGDGNDSEYIYLSDSDFRRSLKNGEMLEYTEYGEFLYGTPRSEIDRIFNEGRYPLLVLDINGVKSLKNYKGDFKAFSVYFTEEISVLDARLYERALADGLSEKALSNYEKRRVQNRADLSFVSERCDIFDLVLKNETVDGSASAVLNEFYLI